MAKPRELWLDYLRAFACILVSLGHLLMSFQESSMIRDNIAVSWFVELIYHFHVYIFFFCSGFLFQKKENHSYRSQIEKALNFIILYILFSGITYAIKMLVSNVNTPVDHRFFETLLRYPINQMWYLYAISTIFLFVRPITSKKDLYTAASLAIVLKIISMTNVFDSTVMPPLRFLCQDMIWFVLGQLIAYQNIQIKKAPAIGTMILFVFCATIAYLLNIQNPWLSCFFTFTGILSAAGFFQYYAQRKPTLSWVWKYTSKYMLQIYLLHTICAAGIRIILFKVGISSLLIHMVMGLLFSFVVPVLCAVVADRIPYLNVVFFPVKTIKQSFVKASSKKLTQ